MLNFAGTKTATYRAPCSKHTRTYSRVHARSSASDAEAQEDTSAAFPGATQPHASLHATLQSISVPESHIPTRSQLEGHPTIFV
jgi:hypothetical protein